MSNFINSYPMLQALESLGECGAEDRFSLVCSDVNDGVSTDDALVVIMNHPLQLVSPKKRVGIVSGIFRSLRPVMLFPDRKRTWRWLGQVFIDRHHEFKQDLGYSRIGISLKRYWKTC